MHGNVCGEGKVVGKMRKQSRQAGVQAGRKGRRAGWEKWEKGRGQGKVAGVQCSVSLRRILGSSAGVCVCVKPGERDPRGGDIYMMMR